MTNWLENLCSQMDLADQPCGPITSIFSEAKQKPRNAQTRYTQNPLLTLRRTNANNYEVLHTLSLMYCMIYFMY